MNLNTKYPYIGLVPYTSGSQHGVQVCELEHMAC